MVCILDINAKNCNLELAEKLGKQKRFQPKMSEDWAGQGENGRVDTEI